MSRTAIVADVLRTQARQLKMPGLTGSFEDLAARHPRSTGRTRITCTGARRGDRLACRVRRRQWLHAAGFPETKTLDQFDFGAAEGVHAPKIAELARCDWITRGENVLFAGPIGTGKTYLAISLGIESSATASQFLASGRPGALAHRGSDAEELGRTMRRLERIDLLIVDEVGFVPFDRQGREVLFNILAARHGRRSVLVTTNLAFAEWPRVFGGDEKLTTALLDRLAEHAAVITTKGKSYRMRKRGADAQAQAAAPEALSANSTSHQKEARSK